MKYQPSIAILATALAACAAQPALTPDQVIQRFRDAGLTVAHVTTSGELLPEVQNAAPSCTAHRFDVEGDEGARVVVCASEADAERVATYYTTLGESSPLFFSHVLRRGGLVLQMSGSLPAETFERYAAELP